ncbi:hypothetical protein JavanS54_0028 [Streptococcus satellite phage Javan54]|nr:hypothetical protein JavanS54_0028 [Streptococcus satellite phage Javan54]CCW41067.1 hypothetical protein MSA_22130 [Streptococcus agalactiae ILRI005]
MPGITRSPYFRLFGVDSLFILIEVKTLYKAFERLYETVRFW